MIVFNTLTGMFLAMVHYNLASCTIRCIVSPRAIHYKLTVGSTILVRSARTQSEGEDTDIYGPQNRSCGHVCTSTHATIGSARYIRLYIKHVNAKVLVN